MIDDVLFEAAKQIRQYQLNIPQCCNDAKAEIDAVVFIMDMLRKRFETPPMMTVPEKDALFLKACVLLVQDFDKPELFDEWLMRWLGPLPSEQ
jgi:hypothetical protein